MTTVVRYDPQLALDEEPLQDGTLESLLEDLAEAKTRLSDAKGFLDDYLDTLTLDGKYRCGRFRVVVAQRRTLGVTVPKLKGRPRAAVNSEVVRAAEKLVTDTMRPGSGVDGITFSAGGESVAITPEDAERIRSRR